MIPYLRALLWDSDSFFGLIRGGMAGLGAVLLQAQELGVSEVLPVLDSTPAKWLGAGAIAAALKLRSSHPELKSQQ